MTPSEILSSLGLPRMDARARMIVRCPMDPLSLEARFAHAFASMPCPGCVLRYTTNDRHMCVPKDDDGSEE